MSNGNRFVADDSTATFLRTERQRPPVETLDCSEKEQFPSSQASLAARNIFLARKLFHAGSVYDICDPVTSVTLRQTLRFMYGDAQLTEVSSMHGSLNEKASCLLDFSGAGETFSRGSSRKPLGVLS